MQGAVQQLGGGFRKSHGQRSARSSLHRAVDTLPRLTSCTQLAQAEVVLSLPLGGHMPDCQTRMGPQLQVRWRSDLGCSLSLLVAVTAILSSSGS